MFDCHVHSSFSGDSETEAVLACEAAITRGLTGIAFTDHLDYDYPGYEDTFLIDFNVYSEFMDALKAQYQSRLNIIKGIEVGIQPHVIDETAEVVMSHNFDYVLASVHIIDRMDPYNRVYYNGKTKVAAFSRYIEEIIFMVDNFHDFDMVGHLDYILRYASYPDSSLYYSDMIDLFDLLFKKIISRGKGFEVNTASYRDGKPGLPSAQFDINILKRYKELGGELICLSSDSHHKEYLGYKFEVFARMLIDSGFTHTVHFEERKHVFDKLEV